MNSLPYNPGVQELPPQFTGKGMELCAVVCPNGMGHFGRTTGILSRLQDKLTDLKISVVASEHQLNSEAVPAANKLWQNGAHGVPAQLDPGVSWSTDPSVYDDGRLTDWVSRVRELPKINNADVVVSDNLAGVLGIRNDAVLQGNFLWSDNLGRAFPGQRSVQEFAAHENSLLAANRPPMICVGAIASQAVLESTTPVKVDWMVHDSKPASVPRDERSIAVFGGGQAASEILAQAAISLARSRQDWRVYAQPKLRTQLPEHIQGLVSPIGAEYNSYARFGAVVCRPGVGTVTACVEACTPIIALHEPNSPEMEDVGSRIAKIGIGRYLGSKPDNIAEAVESVTLGNEARIVHDQLRAQPREGIAQAASWLATRLYGLA